MNCSDFESKVDLYLDGVLPSEDAEGICCHLSSCRSCEALVTRHQQTASLLRGAVADRASVVDLSGLWRDIEARLEPQLAPEEAKEPEPAWIERLRQWWSTRPALMPIATPLRAGAWAAAMAVAVVVVAMSLPETATQLRQVQKPVNLASASTPRRMARTLHTVKSKSVRIDSLEVAGGHTVTTWMRPRTNTRMILIADNDGFAVSDASFSR